MLTLPIFFYCSYLVFIFLSESVMNVIFLVWVFEEYNINTCFQIFAFKKKINLKDEILVSQNNFTRFSHVPDYQEWERKMFSCLWSCLVTTISVMMYGFALERLDVMCSNSFNVPAWVLAMPWTRILEHYILRHLSWLL